MDRIAKRSGLARYIQARQLDGSRFRIMDIGENLAIEPEADPEVTRKKGRIDRISAVFIYSWPRR